MNKALSPLDRVSGGSARRGRALRMSALEPRILLDAAAAATVADAVETRSKTAEAKPAPQAETPATETPTTAPAADAAPATGTASPAAERTLVVVDARVQDAAAALASLGDGVEVVTVGADESGVDKVAQALQNGAPVGAIHVLSHGSAGSLTLGTDTIDAAALTPGSGLADRLASWSAGLTADADVLLYGCSIGAGAEGEALLATLATVTGADLAASDDATGAAGKGGDWVLERTHGTLDARSELVGDALAGWDALMAAPTLKDSATVSRVVDEDGTLTVSGVTVTGDGTLTVSLSVAENGGAPTGRLTLNGTSGLTFTTGDGTNDASMVFTGTAADVQAALNGMTYRPTGNFNGAAEISLGVVDANTLSASLTMGVEVVQANDAPDLTPLGSGDAGLATVNEGVGSSVVLTAAHFGISDITLFDPDLNAALSTAKAQSTDQITFEVTTVPNAAKGRLLKDGAPLVQGSLFTLADLLAGKIRYEHQGAQVNNTLSPGSQLDSFTVTVRDGAQGQGSGTIYVRINPVNQAPAVTGGLPSGEIAFEGRLGVPVEITVTDPDQTASDFRFQFSNVNTQGGTLYLDRDGNNRFSAGDTQIVNGTVFTGTAAALTALLKLDVSGDEPGAPVTFDLAVTDDDGGTHDAGTTAGDGLTTTTTVTIRPVENNDHPVLVTNAGSDAGAPLDADTVVGGTNVFVVPVTNALLNVTDVDSRSETLSYIVTQDLTNTNGKAGATAQLIVNGKAARVGTVFTQDDINSGVVFLQYTGATGSGPYDFQFRFDVRDGEITAFSVERQVKDPIDGGTRNAGDTAYLSHEFNVRFDPQSGTGPGGAPDWPVNDPPVVTIVGIDANQLQEEGALVQIGTNGSTGPRIEISDDDKGASGLTVRLEKAPVNGGSLVYKEADGSYRVIQQYQSFTQQDLIDGKIFYRHEGGEQFLSANLGFRVSVSDGMQSFTPASDPATQNNFSVEAAPVNDKPTASVDKTGILAEGETIAFNSAGQPAIRLADVDGSGDAAPAGQPTNYQSVGGELLVRITSLPAHGKLYIGTTELHVGDTLTKAEVESANFKYTHDGSENFADSFVLTVEDSKGQANSVGDPITVSLKIAPLNDSPAVDPSSPAPPSLNVLNSGLQVAEGGTGTIAGTNAALGSAKYSVAGEPGANAQLVAFDPDNTATQIQYRITTAVTKGRLMLDGRVLGLNSTFTQADLDAGRITYRHLTGDGAGLTMVTDFFEFVVDDAGGGPPVAGKFDIEIGQDVNDPPTVSVPAGPIDVTDTTTVAVPGISVGDKDTNGSQMLQVTLRLLQADGTPLAAGGYAGLTFGSSSPGTATVSGGTGAPLVLRGTVTEINAYLAGLNFSSTVDTDAARLLEVVVDDRTRDLATGALVTTGDDANGGDVNQNPGGGAPTAIPGAEFDPLTDRVSTHAAKTVNIVSDTVNLRISTENDRPTLTVPGAQTVLEDVRTVITGFDLGDAESAAYNLPITVTLHVDAGSLAAVGSVSGVTAQWSSATKTLTLTGAADKVKTLLDNGVRYTSGTHDNIDSNGATAGDVTVTVTVTEGTAEFGAPTGAPVTPPQTFTIAITPVNDKPGVTQANGTITITGGNATTPVAVSGFSVGDRDIVGDPGDLTADETDFVQVTVRLLDENGSPLNAAAYTGVTLGFNGATPGGITVDTTYGGSGKPLVLRGTLSDVNAALAALHVTVGATLGNSDHTYKVEVVADDRLRDAGGTLTGGANGGTANNDGGYTSAGAVPGTAFDVYTTAASSIWNLASATRDLRLTANNDAPSVGGTIVATVNEDVRTRIGGTLTLADPESDNFDLPVRVTLGTGGHGTLSLKATGTTADGTVISGVTVVSGDGTGTLVLKGKASDIQALVNHATNGLFYTSALNDNADANGAAAGDVTLTVTLNEDRAATDFGFTAQEASQTYAITVEPVNDAPVIGGTMANPSAVVAGDGSGTTAAVALTGTNVTVTDVDLDAALNATGADSFGGGTLTIRFGAYRPGDRLILTGTPAGVAGTAGGSGNALVITLTDTATAAEVKAIIEAVRYASVDADPTNGGAAATRAYQIVLNDGNNTHGAADAGGPAALDSNILNGTISFQLPPEAVNDTGQMFKTDPPLTGTVLTNDSDPENDLRGVSAVGGSGTNVGQPVSGTYGSLTLKADGTWTYTVNTANTAVKGLAVGQTLTETYSYTVVDGQGLTDTATLTITIKGASTAPTARDNSGAVTRGGTETDSGNVITDNDGAGLDSDPEGDTLTVSQVGGTAVPGVGTLQVTGTYGTLTIARDGSYTYTLDPANPAVAALTTGQTLQETFHYTATDGGSSAAADLVITINGPAAPPKPAPTPDPAPKPTPDPKPPGPAPVPPGHPPAPPPQRTGETPRPSGPLTAGGTSSSAFEAQRLVEQREAALPFLALGRIDGYRQPLMSPVELTVELQDRVLAQGTQTFAIPATAFRHSDPAERISVTASLSDGSQLPSYIAFDSETGTFVVETDVPRALGVEGLDVRVTGRDTAGNEASTSFHVTFTETDRTSEPRVVIPASEDGETTREAEPRTGGEARPAPAAGEGGGETPPDQPEAPSDQQAVLPGRPATAEQIGQAGRQAALTARDQLLTDLLSVFRNVA